MRLPDNRKVLRAPPPCFARHRCAKILSERRIMTQITTVEELIEILNADPEIRQRLFEAFGLSALPELFRRMDSFEETQQRMLETLAQHSEMLLRHGEILKEHSDSLRILREDVTTLDGKVDDLKAIFRGEQVERKAFNVVSGQLSRIADKRIRRIEPILNQSGGIYYNMQHMWPVHDARLDGKISDSDQYRLMVTDLIFQSLLSAGSPPLPGGGVQHNLRGRRGQGRALSRHTQEGLRRR